MAESGQPSKLQIRSCLTCSSRFSDFCFDKHTFASNFAIRYVILLLFAMDVVLGLPISANLREAPAGASTKHVSMGKAKAASPPITNFSASACRLTPVFSVPVIILPIDAQSLDINEISRIRRTCLFI